MPRRIAWPIPGWRSERLRYGSKLSCHLQEGFDLTGRASNQDRTCNCRNGPNGTGNPAALRQSHRFYVGSMHAMGLRNARHTMSCPHDPASSHATSVRDDKHVSRHTNAVTTGGKFVTSGGRSRCAARPHSPPNGSNAKKGNGKRSKGIGRFDWVDPDQSAAVQIAEPRAS